MRLGWWSWIRRLLIHSCWKQGRRVDGLGDGNTVSATNRVGLICFPGLRGMAGLKDVFSPNL